MEINKSIRGMALAMHHCLNDRIIIRYEGVETHPDLPDVR
jgi:hypothetical protein